jgi:hypothetical protein
MISISFAVSSPKSDPSTARINGSIPELTMMTGTLFACPNRIGSSRSALPEPSSLDTIRWRGEKQRREGEEKRKERGVYLAPKVKGLKPRVELDVLLEDLFAFGEGRLDGVEHLTEGIPEGHPVVENFEVEPASGWFGT